MMLKTANGSLMKVTQMEGQRMLDEHPFDYYYEPDGCEVCEKESWTVCDVRNDKMDTVRMCHSCYIAYGGSDEGWNRIVDAEMKRIEAKTVKNIELHCTLCGSTKQCNC